MVSSVLFVGVVAFPFVIPSGLHFGGLSTGVDKCVDNLVEGVPSDSGSSKSGSWSFCGVF